jgi:hypothetical protein
MATSMRVDPRDDPQPPSAGPPRPLASHEESLAEVMAACKRGRLSLAAISGLLGHKSPQTSSRYIDWADDPLRDASSRVASRISAAMGATAPELPDNVRPLRR